jgi:glycosyltransferase involved in cell wall biosynthesis
VNQRRFILGVGRLSYVKGFDQLIIAFNNAKIKDVDLLIVGDGEERDNLTRLIDDLCMNERVKLVGARSDLQNYYSQAEMFVLPSRNEGYPNALVEAMSLGCPCIAMDCEFGPSEIIDDGRNGLLIKANTIDELSSVMTTLINDTVLKGSLSRQASEINKTNHPDIILKEWENLIFKHAYNKPLIYS